MSTSNSFEEGVMHLSNLFRNQQAAVKEQFGMSPVSMEILQFIELRGRQKMKDIGDRFHIKLSTLTSIIDNIERRKLVKRINSQEDRRVVYLKTTEKGRNLYKKYVNMMAENTRDLDSLDPEERERVMQGLSALSAFAHQSTEA